MVGRVTYRVLNENVTKAVKEFIKSYYVPRNVVFRHLGITEDTIKDSELARIEFLIKQGNSFGAFDENGELCGTVIADTMDSEEFDQRESRLTEQEWIEERICETLTEGDVKALLETDMVWEFTFACVAPKYSGKGVVEQLKNRARLWAGKKGCQKVIRFSAYNPDIDTWGSPFRLIRYEDYIDPVTGKREFEGMMPRYTHHCLHVDDVVPNVSPRL